MRLSDKSPIARRFNRMVFHDDDLFSVKMEAPHKKGDSAKIEFEFREDSTQVPKILSFSGCANIRWVMDFDVMADNWFAQTEGTVARTNADRMRRFVRAQARQWHLQYMPPSPKDKPIRKKLSTIRKYVLFRVTFYGGTVDVLAKNFKLRRLEKA